MKMMEMLKWACAIFLVISGRKMSSVVREEKEKGNWFYSAFEVLEYIDLTRQQNGRIGGWFWLFLMSVITLLALLIVPTL